MVRGQANWEIPEGLRVLPDGSWRVGEHPVQHAATLAHFKRQVVVEPEGVFVVQGGQRLPVQVEGPLFEVVRLVLDRERQQARVFLDDGSESVLADDALSMSPASGRFECRVREGRARAVFSRGAHQTLLEHAEQEEGRFYLRVGARRLPIET